MIQKGIGLCVKIHLIYGTDRSNIGTRVATHTSAKRVLLDMKSFIWNVLMGRHKEFDPEEVLDRAMSLFWRQGFEKTSMQELVDETGIHKRSMYDTFGDKHTLFLMALGRYADMAERGLHQTSARDGNARQIIRELLESSVVAATDHALGCMLVNCATEVATYDSQAAARINDNFDRSEKLITQIVARGQAKSEITEKYEAAALGSIIFNTWVGIRVQARSGIPASKLQKMVDSVMALLD